MSTTAATSPPHGYLMLDLKPSADDEQRLRINMLPGETSDLQQYVRKTVDIAIHPI